MCDARARCAVCRVALRWWSTASRAFPTSCARTSASQWDSQWVGGVTVSPPQRQCVHSVVWCVVLCCVVVAAAPAGCCCCVHAGGAWCVVRGGLWLVASLVPLGVALACRVRPSLTGGFLLYRHHVCPHDTTLRTTHPHAAPPLGACLRCAVACRVVAGTRRCRGSAACMWCWCCWPLLSCCGATQSYVR